MKEQTEKEMEKIFCKMLDNKELNIDDLSDEKQTEIYEIAVSNIADENDFKFEMYRDMELEKGEI